MPELIILISAVICVGSTVVLYFHRSNPGATGVAVLSFITLLYGVAQYVEQNRIEIDGRSGLNAATVEKPAARVAGVVDGDGAKQSTGEPQTVDKDKWPGGQAASQQQTDLDGPRSLPLPQPNQLSGIGGAPPSVVISNFTSRKAAANFVEVSGTVTNANNFAIKNIVVICGDASFARGDVSATVDKTIAAKSTIQITALRMGPVKAALPPTACLVAKYDRAD